jgi:hypothetical protein
MRADAVRSDQIAGRNQIFDRSDALQPADNPALASLDQTPRRLPPNLAIDTKNCRFRAPKRLKVPDRASF